MLASPVILLAISLFASTAFSQIAPQGLTLQGQFFKPDETPLEAESVTFTVQIRSPGAEDCLLYEEQHIVNMVSSNGVFNLTLGNGTRPGSGAAATSTLAQTFSNSVSTISSLTCTSGTTYTPTTGDKRKVKILFDEGTGLEVVAQSLDVLAVPYALTADSLQGKAPSDFVQTIDTNTQTRFSDAFSARYSDFNALLSGTSAFYMKPDGTNFTPSMAVSFNSQRVTNVATPTAATDAANKNYCDANIGGKSADSTLTSLAAGDSGKVLSWDGTKWVAQTASVASHTHSTTEITSGTLSVTRGGTGATSFTADSLVISNVTGTALTGFAPCSAGQVMGSNGTAWGCTTPSSGLPATGGTAAAPGYAFSGDTNTGIFGAAADQIGISTAGSERIRVDAAGNVGVGTTNPTSRLHVEDSANSSVGSYVRNTNGGATAYTEHRIGNDGGFVGALGTGSTGTGAAYNDRLYLENDSSTSLGMSFIYNGDFRVYKGGSSDEKLRIDSSGNVGIGTSSPTTGARLDVTGTGVAASSIVIPRDTVANRPTTGVNGMIRYASDTNKFEAYENGAWVDMIGGGGGAASSVAASVGSAGTPSMSFSGDTDTGLYNASSNNTISVAVGGTNIFNLSSAGLVSATTGGASITTADGTAAAPTFSFAGDTDTGWWRPAANTMAASTAGAERVRIDSSGNVGVGTTSPGEKLEVNGKIKTTEVLSAANLSVTSPMRIYFSATTNPNSYSFDVPNNSTRQLTFENQAGGFIGALIEVTKITGSNNDANMEIKTYNNDNQLFLSGTGATSGNVGIGTASPTSKLRIESAAGSDTLYFRGDVGGTGGPYVASYLQLESSVDSRGRGVLLTSAFGEAGASWYAGVPYGGSGFQIGNSSINYGESGTGPYQPANAKLFINPSGNVGIGTTNPLVNLHINSPVGSDSAIYLSDGDVNHGVTTQLPTDVFGRIDARGSGGGGLQLVGITEGSSSSSGIELLSIIGSGSSTVPAMEFQASEKSGTGKGQLGAGEIAFGFTNDNANLVTILGGGNVGIGVSSPTAKLHLSAGSVTAGTAPIKMTSGSLMTTPEAGAIEFDGTNIYYTNTGGARRNLSYQGGNFDGTVTASSGTSFAPGVSFSGDTDSGIYSPALNTVALATGGIEWFRITSTGEAVFGTGEGATPQPVTLRGPAATGSDIAGAPFSLDASNGTGAGGSGALVFRTAAPAASGSAPNALTERMRISPSGNVGVGTTSPAFPLHVLSTVGSYPRGLAVDQISTNTAAPLIHGRKARGTPGSLAAVEAGDVLLQIGGEGVDGSGLYSNAAFIDFVAAETFAGINTGAYMTFSTTQVAGGGVNERMRISDSGNVGIGTTAPTATLDVAGTVKLGTTGVVMTAIKSYTVALDFPSTADGACNKLDITLPEDGIIMGVKLPNTANANTGFAYSGTASGSSPCLPNTFRQNTGNTKIGIGFENWSGGSVNPASTNFTVYYIMP